MGRGKGKEGERIRKGKEDEREVKGVAGGGKEREGKEKGKKKGRGTGKGEMVPHFLVQSDANVSQRYMRRIRLATRNQSAVFMMSIN